MGASYTKYSNKNLINAIHNNLENPYLSLPDVLHGETIKFLKKDDLLNLRLTSKCTRKAVSKYGTILREVNSLEKLQEVTEKNNKEKIL